MIWDPIEWLLLLLIIILLLFLTWLLLRRLAPATPQAPWVLYDSIGVPGRETLVKCGGKNGLTVNTVRNLQLHVELENQGDCAVTLSAGNTVFLTVPGPGLGQTPPKYGTAFISLLKGDSITYQCKTDESKDAVCTFKVRMTVR